MGTEYMLVSPTGKYVNITEHMPFYILNGMCRGTTVQSIKSTRYGYKFYNSFIGGTILSNIRLDKDLKIIGSSIKRLGICKLKREPQTYIVDLVPGLKEEDTKVIIRNNNGVELDITPSIYENMRNHIKHLCKLEGKIIDTKGRLIVVLVSNSYTTNIHCSKDLSTILT